MDKLSKEEIFVGCKYPKLIDTYINGIRDATKAIVLSELKDTISNIKGDQFTNKDYGKGYIEAIDGIISAIDAELKYIRSQTGKKYN